MASGFPGTFGRWAGGKLSLGSQTPVAEESARARFQIGFVICATRNFILLLGADVGNGLIPTR